MEEVKLTDKEELFCKEFIKDLNRTQAAIRAKYSKASAATIGSELLRKPHIRARVQELFARAYKNCKKKGPMI